MSKAKLGGKKKSEGNKKVAKKTSALQPRGLVHIYTGDGKGKSTAGLGLAVRAYGAGKKVLFAQLFKEDSSEKHSLAKLGIAHFEFKSRHPFFAKYSAEEIENQKMACEAFVLAVFERAAKEKYDLLVLDEAGPALSHGVLSKHSLSELIKARPAKLELALTGRGFPEDVLSLADYVSEIKAVRHPFDKGIPARKGIEY